MEHEWLRELTHQNKILSERLKIASMTLHSLNCNQLHEKAWESCNQVSCKADREALGE
jgi:hypothetical protein